MGEIILTRVPDNFILGFVFGLIAGAAVGVSLFMVPLWGFRNSPKNLLR
jgi:hypothetical protein